MKSDKQPEGLLLLEEGIFESYVKQGKMHPSRVRFCSALEKRRLKRQAAKSRRRAWHGMKAQYGTCGHSSYWD